MQPQERDNWYMPNAPSIKKKKDKCNFDAKIADKRIKYCVNCNECWDSRTKVNIKDFVSYGKEKKICPTCKGRVTLCLSLI